MAGYFSVYMSEKILNNVFLDNTIDTSHSTVYAALFFSTAGTEAALRSNSPINEVDDVNYARLPLTLTGGATFNTPAADTAGMFVDNKVTIQFPTAEAAYTTTIEFVVLMDAFSGGNVIMYAPITPTAIGLSNYAIISLNAFKVTL